MDFGSDIVTCSSSRRLGVDAITWFRLNPVLLRAISADGTQFEKLGSIFGL